VMARGIIVGLILVTPFWLAVAWLLTGVAW
jgi:hypothetical protein